MIKRYIRNLFLIFGIFLFCGCGDNYTAQGDIKVQQDITAGQTPVKVSVDPEVNVNNNGDNSKNYDDLKEQLKEQKQVNEELTKQIESLINEIDDLKLETKNSNTTQPENETKKENNFDDYTYLYQIESNFNNGVRFQDEETNFGDDANNSLTSENLIGSDGEIEFPLKGEYSKLTAIYYLKNGYKNITNNPNNEGDIKIYADDNLIFSSPLLDEHRTSIYIDVNLNSCNYIKFVFTGAQTVALYDIKLFK